MIPDDVLVEIRHNRLILKHGTRVLELDLAASRDGVFAFGPMTVKQLTDRYLRPAMFALVHDAADHAAPLRDGDE